MPRGVVIERTDTVGRIVVAGGVVKERIKTVGRVVAAGGVVVERRDTVGRVVVAGVLLKSALTPLAVLLLPVVLFWSA